MKLKRAHLNLTLQLSGKIVLVTGATSGIGTAVAQVFAQSGATVVASGRNTERGNALVNCLAGNGHVFIPCDLAQKQQIQSLVEQILDRFNQLDVLINNAGIVHHRTVPETTDEAWDETMTINVNAVFRLCRASIPIMAAQGGGVIINIASTWGLVGAEKSAAYCASKGAVVQLTRAMAKDHAKENIRVNAVCPGSVDTPMLESEAEQFDMTADEARTTWAAEAPNGKIATAEDVAQSVLFLASDNAKHIHGVSLPLDGGVTTY